MARGYGVEEDPDEEDTRVRDGLTIYAQPGDHIILEAFEPNSQAPRTWQIIETMLGYNEIWEMSSEDWLDDKVGDQGI